MKDTRASARDRLLQLRAVAVRNRWIVLITAVAFCLRLTWLLFANPVPVSDFLEYLQLARDIADHGQYGYPVPTAYRLPFYPAVLAVLVLIRDSVFWLSLFNVALSTSICVLLYAVTRRVGGSQGTSLTAAVICAVYPQFVLLSPVLASEHLVVVLILSSFLVGTSTWGRLTFRMVGTGTLVGLAVLTRGDGAMLGLVVLAFVVTTTWRRYGRGWRPILACVAAFAAGAALVVLPWVVRNEVVMGPGTFLGGNGGQVFWYGHNPDGYGFVPLDQTPMAGLGERDVQRKAWELGLQHVRENPGSVLSSAYHGTTELFAPSLQEYGLFWSSRDADRQLLDHVEPIYATLKTAVVAGAWFLLLVPVLSLLNRRAVGHGLVFTAGAFVLANWLFYAVFFLGNPRYRFVSDVFLAMLAAGVLRVIVAGTGRPTSSADLDVPVRDGRST